MITITTSSKRAPGVVEFERAATELGVQVAIHDIADDSTIQAIDQAEQLLVRVGPKSYERYRQVAERIHNPSRANDIRRTLAAFDKCKSYELLADASVAMPVSEVIKEAAEPSFLPGVVKIPRGNQGKGIYLVSTPGEYREAVDACLEYGECLYQEYIAESKGTDKRLIVGNGRFVAAMQRVATGDDFRANLHLGGSALGYTPSTLEIDLACRAVEALGLEYAGVDIIDSERGPLVLEVNPSPGMAISQVSGVDVAKEIIKILQKRGHHA